MNNQPHAQAQEPVNNINVNNSNNNPAHNKSIDQKIKDMKMNLMIKSSAYNTNNKEEVKNNVNFNQLQNNAPDIFKFFKRTTFANTHSKNFSLSNRFS